MLSLVEPAARLRNLSLLRPTLALVLGSGFQSVLPRIEVTAETSYDSLPGFPPAGVAGHAGRVLIGHLGGINRDFEPGQFMRLTDHLNFMGVNPLRGETPPGRERFVDLTRTYSPELGRMLDQAAHTAKLKLHQGVYVAVSGPSYETPAEIRAFGRLGADAVGMSTVPEVITARQCGLAVAALSCITNAAAGLSGEALNHADVLASAKKVGRKTGVLLEEFARLYGQGG